MTLFLGLIFGTIGTAYMIYGRKQHDGLSLIIGFILIIYPYIFSNAIVIVLIGIVLSLIPVARAKGMI